jgi:hypothetical protein
MRPRGLSRIVENYYHILDIHLPSFDIEVFSDDEECSFQPKNSWHAIEIIRDALSEMT